MRLRRRRWAILLSLLTSAALVAGVVTVVVAGSREPAAALHLMFGDAWLSNGRTGTASHVNGYTGISDAQATIGSADDPFQVVQRKDGAYVLDLKTGRLLSLSSSSLGVSASRAQHSRGSGLQVVTGGDVTWIIDRSSGLVSRVNPTTLAPLGHQIPLGAATGSAVVDPGGTLWVPVSSSGDVMSISPTGATTGHQVGRAGDAVEVAALATGVWAVDAGISEALHLTGSGPARVALPQVPSSPAPIVAADGSSPDLVVLAAGTLLDVNTAKGSASSYTGPAAAGPAQVAVSGSQAYVLHPGQATVDRFGLDPLTSLPSVPVSPGSDQLISKDNLVFVNATDGPQAVAVNAAGHVTDITKYKPPKVATRASATVDPSILPLPVTGAHGAASPVSPTRSRGRGFTPVVAPAPTRIVAARPPPITVPATPAPPPPPTTRPAPPPQASTTTTSTVPPAAPGMAQSVTASADASGTFVVTWQAPASDGGSTITGYTVLVAPQNGGATKTVNVSASAPLQAQLTGLTFGVSYCAQVQAVNIVGGGPTSPAGQACATPHRDAPGAPGNVSAVPSGVGQATVSWTAPPLGPFHTPISHYTVTGGPSNVTVSGLSARVTGLQRGTQYQFSVIATNTNGNAGRAAAAAPITTWDVPGSPTNLTVVASNSAVIVSFGAPTSSGGTPVTGYDVTVNGTTSAGVQSGASYPAPANQPAAVSVTAVNAVGQSTAATGGATPFAPAPTYICKSLTRGFEFNWPISDCDKTANNGNTAFVSNSPINTVAYNQSLPAPPGAQILYFAFVTNWEEWTVGSAPPGGTTPGPVGWAWTGSSAPYPGAQQICEAWTVDSNARGGGYYLMYLNGRQPAGSSCWQTFWV